MSSNNFDSLLANEERDRVSGQESRNSPEDKLVFRVKSGRRCGKEGGYSSVTQRENTGRWCKAPGSILSTRDRKHKPHSGAATDWGQHQGPHAQSQMVVLKCFQHYNFNRIFWVTATASLPVIHNRVSLSFISNISNVTISSLWGDSPRQRELTL